MSLLEEYDDLSDLTPEQKISILGLQNLNPEDLLARNFNLGGITSNHLKTHYTLIPLPLILAEPDRINDLYHKIKNIHLLFDKICEGEVILEKKVIKKIVVFMADDSSLDFYEKVMVLDQSDKFLDLASAQALLIDIMLYKNNHINLIDYLIEKYIPTICLPSLLSKAICYSSIKFVKFLLKKTDDFDESNYKFNCLNITIVDLLYEKLPDCLKLTRYLIKALAFLMKNNHCFNPCDVNFMYKKFLNYYTFDEIDKIMLLV